MESIETISTSPSSRAAARPSADFPDAVGPTSARWVAVVALPRGHRDPDPTRPRRRGDVDELAAQPVRCCGGDAHVGEGAGGQHAFGRCRDVDELVLRRAPGEYRRILLRR